MNLQDIISTLTQSTEIPLLTAFALGIITSINPCQLTINISALTYEFRNGKSLSEAAIYTLGRMTTYTLLGVLVICLVGGGRNIESLQKLLTNGEDIFLYAICAIGLFMLLRSFHHHHHSDDCHNSGQLIRRNGPLGSLVLGLTLALAFCPESAALYFGVLIPMSVTSSMGITLPLFFAIGTAIPVITIAILMAKTESRIKGLSRIFENLQTWINRIIGILFIFLGIYMLHFAT